MQPERFTATREAATEGMERREFLKLGIAGMVGAAFIGGGLAGAERVTAQEQEAPSGSLREEFESAAEEYGVPVEVLIAMGYVNTRWEMPSSETNAYEEGEIEGKGTYGVMALVQNPTTDTLGEAAQLTGLSESALKTDRAANIRGGAALLAGASGASPSTAGSSGSPVEEFNDTVSNAQENLNATDSESVDGFQEEVAGAADNLAQSLLAVQSGTVGGSAVAGVGGGELYAEQVRGAVQSGIVQSL